MSRYLTLALKQASRSRCRHRVGAVLVKGGRILARSCNSRRNSPRIDFRHATFHAEEALVRRLRQAQGAVVYVARIDRSGAPQLARPCARCQRALATRGIVMACYTTATGQESLRIA